MKKTYKIILVLFVILSSGKLFAEVTPVDPGVKTYESTFTATVICPISISVSPTTAFEGYEFVRPQSGFQSYDVDPNAQSNFVITGFAGLDPVSGLPMPSGHAFYFKITDNVGTGPIQIADLFGHSYITKDGVTLKMKWSMGPTTAINSGSLGLHTPVWGDCDTKGERKCYLSGATQENECSGLYYIFCYYETVTVEHNAGLGGRTFSNTVSASYASF